MKNSINIFNALNESLEAEFEAKRKLNESAEDDYMLLDRLRSDCEYYLGNGNRNPKHLWAGNEQGQIAEMRKIMARLPEKPDWISDEDIDRYEKEMTGIENDTTRGPESEETIKGMLRRARKDAGLDTSDLDEAAPQPVDSEMKEIVEEVVEEIVNEAEVVTIQNTNIEPDYIISDVTVLDTVGDGDVQSPDIDALLTLIDESLKSEYSNEWGRIKTLSSSKNEAYSYALVDISTPEILKEFEEKGIEDAAIGKNLILESLPLGMFKFKVNNLNGITKYSKVTDNPQQAIYEWVESEFLHEAKEEKVKELEILKAKTEKETIENYIENRIDLRQEIENIKMFIELGKQVKASEEMKPAIQKRMYAFAAEMPHNIEVTNKEDKYELSFGSLDKTVEIIFGKEWVKETEEIPEVVELKENANADSLIKDYFNHKMDLPELHSKLEKVFGNKKDAVEYFATNEMRLKEGFELGEKTEILDKTDRRGYPIALVKLLKAGEYEYIVAFGYTITNNEISWDYGYYYYDEESGRAAFEKVKSGGNLSESCKKMNENTVKDLWDYIKSKPNLNYITKIKNPQEVSDMLNIEAKKDKDLYKLLHESQKINESNANLPNISEFIYDLDDGKGNAWSVTSYTKDGRGNKIIIVSKNGESENSAKDIKKAVEAKHKNLKGYISENKNHVWFYLQKPQKVNESYEQFNIGDIEVVFNPETYECLYSIPSAEVKDKKVNLTKVPSVDTPYDTNTIIKSYIETKFGVLPSEEEKKMIDSGEVSAPKQDLAPIPTDDVEVPVELDTELEEDELPEEPTEGESTSEIPVEDELPTSETGNAIFMKIRPKQPTTVESLRQRTFDGDTPESNYIVVDNIDLNSEDWNDLTSDLTKQQSYLSGIKPIDRKNYSFNVVKITNSEANFDLLIDPLGYRISTLYKYCR